MTYRKEVNAVLEKLSLSEKERNKIKNSWVYQDTGIINQYKDHQLGSQPIRVVHNMILYMFENTYPSFQGKLQTMVNDGKLNPKIFMIFGEEGIKGNNITHTPRIDTGTRQIALHETFLSYLWCITYVVYILYIEKVDYPKINKEVGKVKYQISEEEISKAKELFSYAKSLIVYYSPWDKGILPNPEIYLAENRNYVEQTNMCYTEAVIFILAHELTHLEKHVDKLIKNTPDSNFLAFEIEADKEAVLHTLKGRHVLGDIPVNTGIVVGLLSMIFFSADTTGTRHPNVEDRITSALEMLNIGDEDPAWGMACVGLELWEEQFNLGFKWGHDFKTPKEQYYEAINQIKKR